MTCHEGRLLLVVGEIGNHSTEGERLRLLSDPKRGNSIIEFRSQKVAGAVVSLDGKEAIPRRLERIRLQNDLSKTIANETQPDVLSTLSAGNTCS